MLVPALIAAALVATSAQAVDLGLRTGGGTAVQAGPVQAGLDAAADVHADTRPARDSVRRTGDAAREGGRQASATAHAAQDAGIATARGARRQASSLSGARVDANGSLQADGHADAATEGPAEGAATRPSQRSDR